MAKFVLSNVGRTNVGFTVYTPIPAGVELMAKNKQRRAKNDNNIYVMIKPNTSVDLIELTGLSVEELMDNPEVRELVRLKADRVVATIETDDAPEPEKVKEAPPKVEPPVVPPPVEETPKVEPPVVPPPVKESPKVETPIAPPPIVPPMPTPEPEEEPKKKSKKGSKKKG